MEPAPPPRPIPEPPARLDLATLLRLVFSREGHDGPPSDHFDGRVFHNEDGTEQRGFLRFLRWRLGALFRPRPAPEPELAPVPLGPAAAPPPRVDGGALRATWVNHATVLLQLAGINVLTDPIWSERAGPTGRLGSRRLHPPGIRFEDLPPVDVLLVSHNHYDHMDLPTLRALARAHSPQCFTGLGNAARLRRAGLAAVTELDWWQSAALPGGLSLTCVPARHFSARGLRDRNRTLWCGFVLTGAGAPVYFAADTGYGGHFEEIRRRFGPPRLALLPIGAYLPRWFMQPVHMSPEEAIRAHRVLQPRTSIAIHFGTFPLADDTPGQAARELESALDRAGAGAVDFRVPDFGRGWDLP